MVCFTEIVRSIIAEKVKASKDPNYGYDAYREEFTDMIKSGIIDPTKVTRTALQNAASVAGLMLTTEVMIADIPEDDKKMMPPMPGGGMGFLSHDGVSAG